MIPQRLGPYRIVRLLGQGGMGAVYAGVHPDLPREVALKTLTAVAPESLLRFEREARLLAQVTHPGVVRVHGLGRAADGTPFLITELIEGRSLAEVSRPSGLPWPAAIRIGRALASAVEAVHRAGVLHRDLKPENALLRPDGSVALIDFGIARAVDRSSLTQSGTLLGTPGYMAPEQADASNTVDARTDVYGLGATVFALLTGSPPFVGPGPLAVVQAVLSGEPDWQALRARAVPAALERVLRRALARRPEDRFATAAELERALAGAEGGDAPELRRRAWIAGVALGGTALAVVGFTVALARWAPRGGAAALGDASPATIAPSPPPQMVPASEARPPIVAKLPLEPGQRLPADGAERVVLFRTLATLEPRALEPADRARRRALLDELREQPLASRLLGEQERVLARRWVAFADDRTLVTFVEGTGRNVSGIDVTSGEERPLSEGKRAVDGVALRPVAGGFELLLTRGLSLWRSRLALSGGELQAGSEELVARLPKEARPQNQAHLLRLLPAGEALLVGGKLQLAVQPLGPGPARLLEPRLEGALTAVAVCGTSALVATYAPPALLQLDLAGRAAPRPYPLGHAPIVQLAALAEGRFVSGDAEGHVVLWSVSGARLGELTAPAGPAHGERVADLVVDPSGRWLLSAADGAEPLRVWDLEGGGRLVSARRPLQPVHTLAVSPDGLLVAVGGCEGELEIWGAPLLERD